MAKWSQEKEEELSLLIKDWLKQNGKSQADLKEVLNANSTRMPAILEVLKKEYVLGGMQRVAFCLCKIEESWANPKSNLINKEGKKDPFGQLDLLLEEIRDDCEA